MSRSNNLDKKKKSSDLAYSSSPNDYPNELAKTSFDSEDTYETRDVDQNDDNGMHDKINMFMKGLENASPIMRSGSVMDSDSDFRLNQEIENFAALEDDPIFKKLCLQSQYEDKPTCKVCNRKFNQLKLVRKKHCKFCGGCVCEDCAKKKRANPEDTSKYVRVCNKCDEKFINRKILKEFNKKLKAKEDTIQDLEKNIREQQVKLANVQKEYDDLTSKKEKNDKHYSEQMTFLSDDINRIKEETKRCEKENKELTGDFDKTQKRVEELDKEIQFSEKECERLQDEAKTLTLKIEAVNQDIAQMNREIRNMEGFLTQNKTPGTSYDDSRMNNTRNLETPSRSDSLMSSVVSNKGASYNMPSRLKGQNKSKPQDDGKSGNCNTSCTIF